jgi:acyl-CoA synthetase (AMP-forming)/AMP-acid ligase II
MEHEAVQQVVTFAMPDKMLGEDIAAAIVLAEDRQASEAEIKAFAAESLAKFKIPKTIVFLDEIPKGATGKLQRIGLAEKLDLGSK